MGDRGNVVIYQEDGQLTPPLFFYSHWGGSSLLKATKAAIKAAPGRWNDPSYLTRIIWEGITAGSTDPFLGWGIGNRLTDNGHALIVVDIPAQRVRVIPEISNPHDWSDSSPGQAALSTMEIGGTDFKDC